MGQSSTSTKLLTVAEIPSVTRLLKVKSCLTAVDLFEGYPKMSVMKHEGKKVVKCSADGNHHPPQISWEFDHEPEFHGKIAKV